MLVQLERVTEEGFEEYLQKHICQPLGIKDMTFRLRDRPDMGDRLCGMTLRQKDGSYGPGDNPFPKDIKDCFGGAGLWTTVDDFMAVQLSLLRNDAKLLKPETRDTMFEPQLATDAYLNATRQIVRRALPAVHAVMLGGITEDVRIDFGFGGLLLKGDAPSGRRQGSMNWGGYPNLLWVRSFTQSLIMPPPRLLLIAAT